jgi:hypothetical protein
MVHSPRIINMKKKDILNIIVDRPPSQRLYLACKLLKELGVDPVKLEGIGDDRPVPVLVSDLYKLCKPKRKPKGDEQDGTE